MAMANLVNLDPPLPVVGSDGRVGFAVGLGTNVVSLAWSAALATRPSTERVRVPGQFEGGRHEKGELEIALPPTVAGGDVQLFRLRGQLTTPTLFQVDDGERCHELLTIVRKEQHIRICESNDVEGSERDTGFQELLLGPLALPELASNDLLTTRHFLGRTFSEPILITGMTGGVREAAEINRRLARVAAEFNIPMGVGSQRLALENAEHAKIFAVKKDVRDVFLIGNVGMAQLGRGIGLPECERAVEMINADALAIHLNVLQEMVQIEGDRDFRYTIDAIGDIVRQLSVPVLIKEVGCGIDPLSAQRLLEVGVKAIDVGGSGGTSWSLIEGMRAQGKVTKEVGNTYRDWGIPTAYALAAVHDGLSGAKEEAALVATGGIRDGLMVAKAVALGATMVGVGLPLFRAALKSEEAPMEAMTIFTRGLKVAMLCSGARTLCMLPGRLARSRRFEEKLSWYVAPYRKNPYEEPQLSNRARQEN